MKQKIVIVSHCFLNDAAKLRNQDAADMEQERTKKRSFLRQLLERGIEVIQLPCPEFIPVSYTHLIQGTTTKVNIVPYINPPIVTTAIGFTISCLLYTSIIPFLIEELPGC